MTTLPSPPVVVAFGDSITYGYTLDYALKWTTLLEAKLRASMGSQAPQIINAGRNGNTSAEGLQRMEKDVLPHQPSLVLIEFGGNDTLQDSPRHVPLGGFRDNLRAMYLALAQQGARVVLLSFPPVVDAWHSQHNRPGYLAAGGMDRYIQQYRDATREMADELHCSFFDMDGVIRQAAMAQGWEQYVAPDGIHWTAQAHQQFASALASSFPHWLD